MLTGLFGIGSAIITMVSDYFKGKQEINKTKLEGKIKVLVAEAEAKVRRLEREAEIDYDLDRVSVAPFNILLIVLPKNQIPNTTNIIVVKSNAMFNPLCLI